ncbi:ATP-binding protein [Alloiococcus sp. CFN-8]|uniref:ATP-binding protein n=1 Tax=Alloiococcus sp. CFN-8 TaxID=3416081 RepID=UPI003CF4B48D
MKLNPYEILEEIEEEDKRNKRGNLKIFFGYAAGVGKTYAMLEAAHKAKEAGVDVVIGYVEPHTRPDTLELLEGLEVMPTLSTEHKGTSLKEFNLDEALKRRPDLIIVDELAHTVYKGGRHVKRYQDIEELLKAGIDVYTTVNVQHIESLNDTVAAVTGVIVRERIPDRIFDNAEQVELVDIEPRELIERLNSGKVDKMAQVERALNNFFSMENLTALREIALRRCADRINLLTERSMRIQGNRSHGDEHILVCLSPSPSNGKIIRTAARMATAYKGRFTALLVETPEFSSLSEDSKKHLRENLRLAEQLGAAIEAVYGDDIAFQISEFARLSGATKVVMGRDDGKRRGFLAKPSIMERLLEIAPNLDIHIIPVSNAVKYRIQRSKGIKDCFNLWDSLISLFMVMVATIIGEMFQYIGLDNDNIITVYILGVLIVSILTSHRLYCYITSIISVLAFNFFFIIPKYSLDTYDNGYIITFFIMLIAALISSSLTMKIKQHAKRSAETAYRTQILFETNQLLSQEQNHIGIISVTANHLVKLLGRTIVFYDMSNDILREPLVFNSEEDDKKIEYITKNERAVAAWVAKNNKRAGASTNTLGDSKCLYLAVRSNEEVFGVVGIVIDNNPLDSFENSIVLSILGECALALKNEKTLNEREEAAIMAKNELMRANLLRSISHDLRTPLTSISGNAAMLMDNEDAVDIKKRRKMYSDIYEESLWLINLVENILSVTQIENGSMNLNTSSELMEEIVEEALKHINKRRGDHKIIVTLDDSYPMVEVDAKLIVQVIINILDNGIKYTPKESEITILIKRLDNKVLVEIGDNGPGIPDESKERIFEMFYSLNNNISDSRRSLGLGLALCKSIITAHGGEITVRDNYPKGTIFAFTLPLKEVSLYE